VRTISSLVLIGLFSIASLAQEPTPSNTLVQPAATPVSAPQVNVVQQGVITQPTVPGVAVVQTSPPQPALPPSLSVPLYQPTQPQNLQPLAQMCGCAIR